MSPEVQNEDSQPLRDLTKSEAIVLLVLLKKYYASSQEFKAQMRRVLFQLHERKGHKALGYATFQDMVGPEAGIKRGYATELVNATRVELAMVSALPDIESANLKESQLGVLFQIWKANEFDVNAAVRVFRKASENCGEGRRPSAVDIRRVALEMDLMYAKCTLKRTFGPENRRGSLYPITTPRDSATVTHNIEDGSFDVFSDLGGGLCEQVSMDMFAEAVADAEMKSGKVSPIRENLTKAKRVISPSKQESLPFSD